MPGQAKINKAGLTRRQFLGRAGQVGVAAGAAGLLSRLGRRTLAAEREYILIGRPAPLTGPIAGFGEAAEWVAKKAAEAINAEGGIYLEERGQKVPVKIKILDTKSNLGLAGEAASRLILADKADLIVTMHTAATVNPVSGYCERYQTPCISLNSPVESWLSGGPYQWCWHAFWTVEQLADLYLGMWGQAEGQTNKIVGGLWNNDPDGEAIAAAFLKKLPQEGYKIIDPGRLPVFTQDYTAYIARFKTEKIDILTGMLVPPEWGMAWRQFHQQGFVPKIATIAKAILFPSDVGALGGDLPLGLTTEVWWSPGHPYRSSLTSQTAKELCQAWTKETGKQWTQPLGFDHAGFEIAADVLKRAKSLDKEAIRQALSQTELETIVGRIKYNQAHYCPTPLVGGQWVKGKQWPWDLEIVYNQAHPEIPKTAQMFLLPAK